MAYKEVPTLSQSDISRFMSFIKVNEITGCHEWTGHLNDGYGKFSIGYSVHYAHRVAMKIAGNEIPIHLQTNHRATCPKHCVNPEHLEAVTPRGNMLYRRDYEESNCTILTREKVEDLKLKLNAGMSVDEASKTFGIATDTVYSIGRGYSWSDVRPDLNIRRYRVKGSGNIARTKRGTFTAVINHECKRIYLGTFQTEADAESALARKRVELGIVC